MHPMLAQSLFVATSAVCSLLVKIDRSVICSTILLSASTTHFFPGQDALLIAFTLLLQSSISISCHCLNHECSLNSLLLFATLSVVSCAWALLSSRQAEGLSIGQPTRDSKEAKIDIKVQTTPLVTSSCSQMDPLSSPNVREASLNPYTWPSSNGGTLTSVSEKKQATEQEKATEDAQTTRRPITGSHKLPDRDKSMSLVGLIQKLSRSSGRNSRDRSSNDRSRLSSSLSPFQISSKMTKIGSQDALVNLFNPEVLSSAAFSSLNFQDMLHKLRGKSSLGIERQSKKIRHRQSCGPLFQSKLSPKEPNPGLILFSSQDGPQPSIAGTFTSLDSFRAWATNPHRGSFDNDGTESPFGNKMGDDLVLSNRSAEPPNASSLLSRMMSSRESVDSVEELEKALSVRRDLDHNLDPGAGRRLVQSDHDHGPSVPFVFAPAVSITSRPPLVPPLSNTFNSVGRRSSNQRLDTVVEEVSTSDSLLVSQNSSELMSRGNDLNRRPLSKSGSAKSSSSMMQQKLLDSSFSNMSLSNSAYQGKDEIASMYGSVSVPPQSLKQGGASYWAAASSTHHREPTSSGGILDELEGSILNHRRQLDETCSLLEEISIDKILGFGSMGMVYHARMWDHQVVVKLIEHGTGLLGKEQNRGRLARVEAAVSRMLIHPNVVITYDCCTGPMDTLGRLSAAAPTSRGAVRSNKPKVMTVMVQEYCEGGTLRDVINKQAFGLDRSLPDYNNQALRIALDIANGMRYLSMLRILHLDLKAENVLMQKMPIQGIRGEAGKATGGYVAKVADFGLAQVLPFGTESSNQGIHGTVSHMPPEVMGQDPSFSFATDVYSFGILLFELMTGGKPFHGMAAYHVVEAVVQRNERPVWPKDGFDAIKDLAHRCVERDPAMRPSFIDIVEDLRDLVDPSRAEKAHEDLSEDRSISNESDELEAALHQQRQGKKLHLATKVMDKSQILQGTSTIAGEETQEHPGPPKDPLGRMLYFLSSMPAFSLVQKNETDAHSCHWSTTILPGDEIGSPNLISS